jgi:hypothetical protein
VLAINPIAFDDSDAATLGAAIRAVSVHLGSREPL